MSLTKHVKHIKTLFVSLFLWGAMLHSVALAQASINVSEVRVGVHGEYTRFVIESSKPLPYSAFTLSTPSRVVIDLPEIKWQAGLVKDRGLIAGLRYGLFQPGVSRIVIDANKPIKIKKHFRLAPSATEGNRLVFDIAIASTKDKSEKVASADWLDYIGKQKNVVVKASPSAPITSPVLPQKTIIVIDPGHGGPDPGAIGVSGAYEKKITLAVAKATKAKMEATGRYTVILTRDRDIYIPLRQRYARAESNSAQLFISLHADKIGRSNVSGASVYTLSEKASDKEAAALAQKENKADIIVGEDLSVYDENVAHILLDIQQRSTMQESAHYAEMLVADLGTKIKLLRNTHRFAGFAVLKSPTVPSVLVELGYLSNRKDEKLLRDPKHHKKIATAILQASDKFFARLDHLSKS